MAELYSWTPERDAALRRYRAAGKTWRTIAFALGASRWTVIERARRIGVQRQARVKKPPPPVLNKFRETLPAGHPYTWNLLTEGTVLDGDIYPYPVFRRERP